MHINKRCRVAKVDDNSEAGANMSDQLPREAPIVLYLVHTCHLLARIHATPVTIGTMADYTLKTFKHGRVDSDSMLVLN